MPGDAGGGIIIIRQKIQENLQAVKGNVKVRYLVIGAAVIGFAVGAVIF